MANKSAPRVTIIHHPEYMYATAHQDDAVAQQVSGTGPDMAHRVNNLLLPVVKG